MQRGREKKSSLYPMRCSSSLFLSVWCWRQQRLVLPATPEAADTHNIQAYKKKDWFISESFFHSAFSQNIRTHTCTHKHHLMQEAHNAENHNYMKVTSSVQWMSTFKIIFMPEQRKQPQKYWRKRRRWAMFCLSSMGWKNVMSKRQICIYGIDRYPPVDRYTVII